MFAAGAMLFDRGEELFDRDRKAEGGDRLLFVPDRKLFDRGAKLVDPDRKLFDHGAKLIDPDRRLFDRGAKLIDPDRRLFGRGAKLTDPDRKLFGRGAKLVDPDRKLFDCGASLIDSGRKSFDPGTKVTDRYSKLLDRGADSLHSGSDSLDRARWRLFLGVMRPPHRPRRRPRIARWAAILPSLLLVAVPASAAAQDSPSDTARRFLVVTGQSRWLNGAQPEAFNPMGSVRSEILRIDSAQDSPTGSRVFLSPRYLFLGSYGTSSTVVSRVPSGQVTSILSSAVRFLSNGCGPIPPLTAPIEIAESQQEETNLTMEMQVLAPFFEPGSVPTRRTISFASSRGLSRDELRGTRISRILHDTTIAGRRYHIMHDSASVSWRNVRIDPYAFGTLGGFLDSVPLVTRIVSGAVVGRRLVDARTGETVWLADTAHLRGTATLHFSDGRSYSTPTRFDRTQEVARLNGDDSYLRNVAVYAAERAADEPGVSDSSVMRRMLQHDQSIRDSLMHLYRTSRRVTQRDSVFGLLQRYYMPPWAELARAMIDAGDTAGFLRNSNYGTPPEERYRLARPALADPGYGFSHGIDESSYLQSIVNAMIANPPALQPDTTKWPCRPAVCRAIAAEWPGAHDPQLRESGLIAAFALDPTKWASTLTALAAEGHRYLNNAAALASGAVPPYGGGAATPAPASGATWHEWSHWMTTTRRNVFEVVPKLASFDGRHRVALDMSTLITGRNYAEEFATRFRSAPSDTERFVFGTMLDGFRPSYRTGADVVAAFATGGPLDRDLAAAQLWRRFPSAPADSATSFSLLGHLVDMLLDGAAPWPVMPGSPDSDARGIRPDTFARAIPRYLVADSLPAWVRDRLIAAGYVPKPYGWHRPDTGISITLVLHPAYQFGPLTFLDLQRTTMLPERNFFIDHTEPWNLRLYNGARGWELFYPSQRIERISVCSEG